MNKLADSFKKQIMKKYSDLCQELGRASFQLHYLEKQIETVRTQIKTLDESYPELLGFVQQAHLAEIKDEETKRAGSAPDAGVNVGPSGVVG